MRLAVIGDTQHYLDADGRLCALEPVVNQLDRWSELFDEVVLCAPLADGPPPKGFAPYRSSKFRIEPLPQGGGNDLRSKIGLLRLIVPWARATRRVAGSVDAIHLRCPCNIGMVAILSTWRAVPRRYAMYAGVWHDYAGEPTFYRLQRRLLASRWFGGPVSIYGPHDPTRPHLEPSFSPSFSIAEWHAAAPAVEEKLSRIASRPPEGPWRLVTVGRLTPNKNQETVLRALPGLVSSGLDVELSVYGDGPCLPQLEELASTLGVADRVSFHGSVDHKEVMQAFAAADLNLLATRQEGFGKVLLEGMVHGTVPVFAESPAAAEISGDGTRGIVFPPDDPDELADAVVAAIRDRERWLAMVHAARAYSATVTLEAFQERVRDVLERHWDVKLAPGVRDARPDVPS
jgi:glycosyltransferase involved in cell wall biosynthesis